MLKKSSFIFISVISLFISVISASAQENDSYTIVTYYPSPYGSYNELSVFTRQAIGDFNADGKTDNNDMAVDILGYPLPGSLTVSGNVGIGTTTPTAKLEIKGSYPQIRLREETGPQVEMGISNTVNAMFIKGTEALEYINFRRADGASNFNVMHLNMQSGNVGIGTASPGSFLDSSGTQVTSLLLDVQPGTSQPGGIIVGSSGRIGAGTTNRQGYFLRRNDNWNSYPSGLWKGSDTSGPESWENLVINNSGGGADIIFMINLAERMRILPGGNVGIGTPTPQTKAGQSGFLDAKDVWLRDANGGVGAWASTGGGGGFGSWESKNLDTVYTAATDGFVSAMAYGSGGNYDAWIGGYTDSSNPPATLRTASLARDTAMRYGITMPVKKGDYWRVVITVGDGSTAGYSVYWLPM